MASTIAFLCLIPAHLECPDMAGIQMPERLRRSGRSPPTIFKAYDVRGLYGEQIDGDVAEAGRARVRARARPPRRQAAGELRIGLGRDMRLTAPELAARYREGMVAEGAHVARRRAWSAPRCSTASSARASSTAG